MGNKPSSDAGMYRVRPDEMDEGPSSGVDTRSVLERLQTLPQLTPSLQLASDPLWEDLRRLQSVSNDPVQQQLRKDIEEMWEAFRKWAQVHEAVVHEKQDELHTMLDDVALLTQRVREKVLQEKAASTQLRQEMEAVQTIHQRAQDLARQLQSFHHRLHNLSNVQGSKH